MNILPLLRYRSISPYAIGYGYPRLYDTPPAYRAERKRARKAARLARRITRRNRR